MIFINPVVRMRTVRIEFEMAAVSSSCEQKRSSAYFEDLRWRIVYQREGLGLTFAEIATNLNIDQSTARRIANLFSATGSVTLQLATKVDKYSSVLHSSTGFGVPRNYTERNQIKCWPNPAS